MKQKLLVLIAILSLIIFSCNQDEVEETNLHNSIKFETAINNVYRLDTLKFTIYDINNNILHTYKEFDINYFSVDINDGHHFKIQAWDDSINDFSIDWTLEEEGNPYYLEIMDLVAQFYGEQEYDYSRFLN